MGYEVRDGYNLRDGYGFPGESAVVPAGFPASPTHVWHLEENPSGPFVDAVTLDSDFDMTVTGEDLTQITGIYGFALSSQTESPSIVFSAGDPQLPSGADFSITFWMRLSAGLNTNSGYQLYSEQSDALQGMWITPLGSGKKLQYHFATIDPNYNGIQPIENNAWANVTITYKHSTKNVKSYVNGVVDMNNTLSLGFDGTVQYFVIGPNDGLDTPNYDFDEIATFDRELTQQEVTALQTAFYPV